MSVSRQWGSSRLHKQTAPPRSIRGRFPPIHPSLSPVPPLPHRAMKSFRPPASSLFCLLLLGLNALPAFGQTFLTEPLNESNNTAAAAEALPSTWPVRMRGNIFPANDVDWYSFDAAAGDRVYAAVITSFDASSSGDSVLTLYRSDGTTVIEEDNNDGTFNASSSSIAGAEIPEEGTYFLRVRHDVATGTLRPYDLYVQVRSGAPVSEVEPNDSLPGQSLLSSGGWVSGGLASDGDMDTYSITLNAGDTLFASLDADPERDATSWNPILRFAPFGERSVQANDGNATSPNSEALCFTVKNAGTYEVSVYSISGTFGTYGLNVGVLPAPAEASLTYTSTDVPVAIPTGPGMVSSSLTIPGNPRIKKLRVAINLNHTFMQDLDASLVTPSGNEIVLFTDIGAATVGGPETVMDIILDDDAALPPSLTGTNGMILQPERNYRLGWLKGQEAGGTWTLVLRDDATGDGGTLNGWSLEIVEEAPLPTGDPTIFYTTDFEADGGGFTHSGVQDEWELGTPTAAPITTAHSGVNCWKTDLDDTYNANANCDLLSPEIDLTAVPPGKPIVFEWFMKYRMENATFDHFTVTVEEAGGGGSSAKAFQWLDDTMTNTVGNPAVTIAQSAGWGRHRVRIDDFAGKIIQLRFHLDTDSTVELQGVAIDDVSVTAFGLELPEIKVEEPVGTELTSGASTVDYGTQLLFPDYLAKTFTVTNTGIGNLDLSDIHITGVDWSDFYLDPTNTIMILEPGESTTFGIEFSPFTSGTKTATLEIVSNDLDDPIFTIALTGKGNTAPIVTLNGDDPVYLSLADPYTDDGATADDAEDGALTPVMTTNTVVPGTPGAYSVTWEATDSDGMVGSYTRTVVVQPGALDKKAPVLRLTQPTAKTKTVLTTFDIAGTVADNFGLQSFEVKLNGEALPLDAPVAPLPNITTPWSVSGVPAENGPNTIEVIAVDLNGRTSRVVKTVNHVNLRPHLAGLYYGRLQPLFTPSNDTTGLIGLNVTASGTFSGTVHIAGTALPVRGVLRNDGTARFLASYGDTTPLDTAQDLFQRPKKKQQKKTPARYLGSLALMIDCGCGNMLGFLLDQPPPVINPPLAISLGFRAPYNKSNPVPDDLLNQPVLGTPHSGVFNLAFASISQPTPIPAADYPQGDGYARMVLNKAGTLSLTGYLADGTKYVGSSRLRADLITSLHTSLYGGKGAIGTDLEFFDLIDNDVDSPSALWIRPALPKSRIYKNGWPSGIEVYPVGTFYAPPASLDFGQGPADEVNGNASLEFENGLLGSLLELPVSVDPTTGKAVRIPSGTALQSFSFTPSTGLFSGKFRHEDGTQTIYRGMLQNKGPNNAGYGFFISNGANGQSGGVTLNPDGP